MTTRPATLDDLDAIMALERASFPTDAWSDAMMREELASPHGWYVVVEEAGRLIGYAGLRAARGATDADIQTIAIAAEARGRGRGRTLLDTLLAEAARRGVRHVFLEVRADNPVAEALYASEGFTEVGRRARYYQPDDVDAIVMRLDVHGWAARPGGPGRAGRAGGAYTTQENSVGSRANSTDSAGDLLADADPSCVVYGDAARHPASDAAADVSADASAEAGACT